VNHFFFKVSGFFVMITNPNGTILSGLFLFLAFDSLIAFKSTLLYCLGSYIMILIKLLYESPRPFWLVKDIESFG
jgi:hypothetical protein